MFSVVVFFLDTRQNMSWNRSSYDPCSYMQSVKQSTVPLEYHLSPPSCGNCYPPSSTAHPQGQGVSVPSSPERIPPKQRLVDIEEELQRYGTLQKCSSTKYKPECLGLAQGQFTAPAKTVPDCFFAARPTRLENPPKNLKGRVQERWDTHCKDPQANAFFNREGVNISNRLLVKDNHRPVIPAPLNQTAVHPHTHRPSPLSSN